MIKFSKSIVTALFLVGNLIGLVARAQNYLSLPMTYGTSMVLQREIPLKLQGRCFPGTEVTIFLKSTTKRLAQVSSRANDEGVWQAILPPQVSGGPYELTFCAGEEQITFTDVWVGEVWLCSGQSNMELRVHEIATAGEDMDEAAHRSELHLFNMQSPWDVFNHVWPLAVVDSVDKGLVHMEGHWEHCSSEAVRNFSAIGFHFGKHLADSLGCHVGLICNAVGGSTTEGWIDSLTLDREVPDILEGNWFENPFIMEWARVRAKHNLSAIATKAESAQSVQEDERLTNMHAHPYAPTFLFSHAVRPLGAYPIRGVLWYQGESNAELPEIHARLFPALEHSWRKEWDCETLPFYTVQLSSIAPRETWPAFRNSQRLLADSLSDTWMVVSSDLGDSLDVHPRRKAPIGHRLALSALHHTYGFTHVLPSGPQPVQTLREGDHIVRVCFAYGNGLKAREGGSWVGFELAGEDGVFYPAEARLPSGYTDGKDFGTLLIETPQVPSPKEIRYAWQPFTHANLENAAGLPCSTFHMEVLSELPVHSK